MKTNDLSDIKKILMDHENRISIIEGKRAGTKRTTAESKAWYKPGSTIEKVVLLVGEGFFNKTKTLTELIQKLKSKDYHMKASDLTLPMRKIVRNGVLDKTKTTSDGVVSKVWLYVKPRG